MDVFAAVALGTEPPQDDIMKALYRKDQTLLLTPAMWRQIYGITTWNLLVMLFFFILGPSYLGLKFTSLDNPRDSTKGGEDMAKMFTFVLNIFVMMTLGNEINCRKIGPKDYNVFKIHQNLYFVFVVLGTFFI